MSVRAKYQKAYFVISAADVKQLPQDSGIEIVFAGRSNAGKSSVINRITGQKRLAYVSKTPGRTQLLNVFALDDRRRLIDVPGYGYAKVPESVKVAWQKNLQLFFTTRQSLKGVILIVDIRRGLTNTDWTLLDFCKTLTLPVHILLNKADKLSKNDGLNAFRDVKSALKHSHCDVSISVQLFSATDLIGLPELYQILDKWFEFNKI